MSWDCADQCDQGSPDDPTFRTSAYNTSSGRTVTVLGVTTDNSNWECDVKSVDADNGETSWDTSVFEIGPTGAEVTMVLRTGP